MTELLLPWFWAKIFFFFPLHYIDQDSCITSLLAASVLRYASSAGSRGKTTTSWFIRGIFEEMQLITGMIGSLENSIAVDKMTDTGDIWKSEAEDPTLKR